MVLVVGRCAERRAPLAEPPVRGQENASAEKLPPSRFLVVDDNADAADTLALMLEFEGYSARAVHSAHEVLAQMQAFRPDIVLLDIGLPGMDGYEVARAAGGLRRALREARGRRRAAATPGPRPELPGC